MKHPYRFHRIAALLTAVLIFPALLCGCSQVKEINDMAIISGFSIDLDSDGLYRVTAEVVNKSTEGAPEEAREVISAKGLTLGDALENCNFQDSRQIYFSHAKTLILSERLAKEVGVGDVLDYVMRNYKTRLSMDLIVAALPEASAAADLSTSSTGLIYYDLEEMIKTDQIYGACTPMKVYQAVNTLQQKDTEMTIPLLRDRDGKAELSGTAVFLDNQMIQSISQEETLYLLMLQDHLTKAHITLPKLETTFQITDSDLSSHPQYAETPWLDVDLKLTCTVSQAGSRLQEYDSAQLASALSQYVESKCDALIAKTQSWGSDIFGFGKAMGSIPYRYSQLPIRVTCTVNLKIGEVH